MIHQGSIVSPQKGVNLKWSFKLAPFIGEVEQAKLQIQTSDFRAGGLLIGLLGPVVALLQYSFRTAGCYAGSDPDPGIHVICTNNVDICTLLVHKTCIAV